MGAGHNIRRVREQRGYDQAELARMVGISASALWKVENEDRTPRGPTLRKLAEVLGVDPSELRGIGDAGGADAAPANAGG